MLKIWQLAVNSILANEIFPRRLRPFVMNALGAKVGRGLSMRSKTRISTNGILIGDRVFINHGVHINNFALVTLGDDVALAPDVFITTVMHDTSGYERRQGRNQYLPVNIGRGTWVGARATVLPGVTIGEGCVIAAGAVVNRNCDPHGTYGGVPARRINDLPFEIPGRRSSSLPAD